MLFAKLLLSFYSFNVILPWANNKLLRTCGCQIIIQISLLYLRIVLLFQKKKTLLKENEQSVQGKTVGL